jgi:hypothetical protein
MVTPPRRDGQRVQTLGLADRQQSISRAMVPSIGTFPKPRASQQRGPVCYQNTPTYRSTTHGFEVASLIGITFRLSDGEKTDFLTVRK